MYPCIYPTKFYWVPSVSTCVFIQPFIEFLLYAHVFIQSALTGYLVYIPVYVQSALIECFLHVSTFIQPNFSRCLLYALFIQLTCLDAYRMAGSGEKAMNKTDLVPVPRVHSLVEERQALLPGDYNLDGTVPWGGTGNCLSRGPQCPSHVAYCIRALWTPGGGAYLVLRVQGKLPGGSVS